jgi:hypothetical protein
MIGAIRLDPAYSFFPGADATPQVRQRVAAENGPFRESVKPGTAGMDKVFGEHEPFEPWRCVCQSLVLMKEKRNNLHFVGLILPRKKAGSQSLPGWLDNIGVLFLT